MASTRIYKASDRARWRRVTNEKVAKHKDRVDAYKAAQGCMDCGWGKHNSDFHPSALDLDHRPGTNKKANVSNMATYNWDVIEDELQKCDVVCARCHRLRTMRRHKTGQQTFRGRLRYEVVQAHPQLFDE